MKIVLDGGFPDIFLPTRKYSAGRRRGRREEAAAEMRTSRVDVGSSQVSFVRQIAEDALDEREPAGQLAWSHWAGELQLPGLSCLRRRCRQLDRLFASLVSTVGED